MLDGGRVPREIRATDGVQDPRALHPLSRRGPALLRRALPPRRPSPLALGGTAHATGGSKARRRGGPRPRGLAPRASGAGALLTRGRELPGLGPGHRQQRAPRTAEAYRPARREWPALAGQQQLRPGAPCRDVQRHAEGRPQRGAARATAGRLCARRVCPAPLRAARISRSSPGSRSPNACSSASTPQRCAGGA